MAYTLTYTPTGDKPKAAHTNLGVFQPGDTLTVNDAGQEREAKRLVRNGEFTEGDVTWKPAKPKRSAKSDDDAK